MDNLSPPLFQRMAIIGPGLIGASLGLVCGRDRLVEHRVGCARTARTGAAALEVGAIDSVSLDPAAAVAGADLVVLATPVGAFADIMKQIAPALEPGCILTDVGSVKKAVVTALAPHVPPGVFFVPAHPIAGTEFSGPRAAFADLFKERWCVLTPPEDTDRRAVDKLATLWRRAGMQVEIMEAGHHDVALAITSHLPHLIAFTIVGTATDLQDDLQKDVIKFAAGGFRDFTRIAASDPVMWRDIFLGNQEAVLDVLTRFSHDLEGLKQAIHTGDGAALHKIFTQTRAVRQRVIEAKQA